MTKAYVNVKIPSELALEIEKVVKDNSLGFRSRADFVIFSVRRTLIELGKNNFENEISFPRPKQEGQEKKVSLREIENPSVQRQSFVSDKLENEGLPSYFIGNPWLEILQSRK